MGTVLAAILSTFVLGIPVALAVDPRCRGGVLAGLAYLYGSGLVWVTLFALSLLHIAWSAVVVTTVLVVIAVACGVIARLRAGRGSQPVSGSSDGQKWSRSSIVIDLLTIYTVFSYTLYATLAKVWAWDFWAIWGLKARAFLETGGIDWRFLRNPNNAFIHRDYPLLLPLNYDWIALINGRWDDRWLGLVGVAFGVALLLIIRDLARREMPALGAAALTFAATAFALSHYVGLAEAPLTAFGGAAVIFLGRAIRHDEQVSLRHGAILLGLAGSSKNEGLALIAAVVLAIILTDRERWRRLVRMWPTFAIIAPWLIARAVLHLKTDIARGDIWLRAGERLRHAPALLRMLVEQLTDPWMWGLMLLAIVLLPSAIRLTERFVYTAVGIQLLFYIGAYVVTPYNVEWHIETSWPRLTRQIATPLLYAVTVQLARAALREQTLAHAEARPEQL